MSSSHSRVRVCRKPRDGPVPDPADHPGEAGGYLDYQKRGLGVSLLQDAIRRAVAVAEHAGIRALLTHPLDAEADAFYRRFGCETMPENARALILLPMDARRLAGAPH
jgi:hypothetical protein